MSVNITGYTGEDGEELRKLISLVVEQGYEPLEMDGGLLYRLGFFRYPNTLSLKVSENPGGVFIKKDIAGDLRATFMVHIAGKWITFNERVSLVRKCTLEEFKVFVDNAFGG